MPESQVTEEPIKLFFSYSRKDLDLRNALEDHLSALREAGKISTWHDLELEAGTEWEPAILNKLDTADIILLLVSRNFIASKYCYGTELKRAIARHEAGTARVIPIILRSCLWNIPEVPFSKLNVLPTHAKPITSWTDQEEAFAIVAQKIRESVEQLRAKMQTGPTIQTQLASEKGVGYTRLRDLLQAGEWKEADRETASRMCEVVGRKVGWLRIEDIKNFPCKDLCTIDQLWVKYSQDRFGFSIQKRIWQEYGSPTSYNSCWEKFGEAVGWKKKILFGISWDWKVYDEITFDTSAPIGHLPKLLAFDRYDTRWYDVVSSLSFRLVACSIC